LTSSNRPWIKIKVEAKSLDVLGDLSNVKEILKLANEMDKLIKVILCIQDIVKIYNREVRS